MNGTDHETTVDRLLREIERYLAAVEAFRAAGCSPQWRRELRVTSDEGSA